MEKIKLVIFNECVLGFITPELSNYVQVLHASILKGSHYGLNPSSLLIGSTDTVRLSSEKDFDDYRCSFVGYNSNEYEFQINQ